MCFDAKTSLEAFIISSLGTGMLYFSDDKIKHQFSYFWLSVSLVQLWEYFIWKNIDNKEDNRFWTIILRINIALQPLIALLILNSIPSYLPKQVLLSILFIELFLLAFWFYDIYNERYKVTVVNNNNNLKWPGAQPDNFRNLDLIRISVYFLALTILPWFIKPLKTGITIGTIILISILLTFLKMDDYNIIKNNGWTSLWCYSSALIPLLQYITI